MITFSLETSHHIYTQRLLISLNIGTGEVSVNKWVLYIKYLIYIYITY